MLYSVRPFHAALICLGFGLGIASTLACTVGAFDRPMTPQQAVKPSIDMGYDAEAYDACIDSDEDVTEEDCLEFASSLERSR